MNHRTHRPAYPHRLLLSAASTALLTAGVTVNTMPDTQRQTVDVVIMFK